MYISWCLFTRSVDINEFELNNSINTIIVLIVRNAKQKITIKEDIKNAVDKIIESGLPL